MSILVVFCVKFTINNFISNSKCREIDSMFAGIACGWIMRLILIIVNQMRSKCGTISRMKNIRRVFRDIKLDKSISATLFFSVLWGYQIFFIFPTNMSLQCNDFYSDGR